MDMLAKELCTPYSGKDLQNVLSLLTYCEASGVLSVKALKALINEGITLKRMERKTDGKKARKQTKICPKCGRPMLFTSADGLNLFVCTNRKRGKNHMGCQYSEVL